jgi:hypothetical protein
MSEFTDCHADERAGRYHGGSNGLLFTESVASKVAEINPTSHVISEFPTPTPGSGPLGITAWPDGFECPPPAAHDRANAREAEQRRSTMVWHVRTTAQGGDDEER